jgi:putative ABC transport system ATP-binding protein
VAKLATNPANIRLSTLSLISKQEFLTLPKMSLQEIAMIVKVSDIKKTYSYGQKIISVINGISLEIERGFFYMIVGASGSGKTTLLNIIGGLEPPTYGSVQIDNTDVYKLSEKDRTLFRRKKIGFIFQNFNLVPILNVYENILFPLDIDNRKPDNVYIHKLISLLGLDGKLSSMPNTLSGGEQQRVAIARSLSFKPSILLADEPTGSLVTDNGMQVMKLLRDLQKELNQTIIMITHNHELIISSDKLIKLENGMVISKNAYR